MRKKDKPFRIDLGFGNMFYPNDVMPRQKTKPTLPTYTGEKYAVYTNREGVIVKHTFRGARRAKGFLETARASGSYDTVSDIQFDY